MIARAAVKDWQRGLDTTLGFENPTAFRESRPQLLPKDGSTMSKHNLKMPTTSRQHAHVNFIKTTTAYPKPALKREYVSMLLQAF